LVEQSLRLGHGAAFPRKLGFQAKLHRNYIGALERGDINPTFRTLLALMRGLDLPLSDLIGLYERHIAEVAQ